MGRASPERFTQITLFKRRRKLVELLRQRPGNVDRKLVAGTARLQDFWRQILGADHVPPAGSRRRLDRVSSSRMLPGHETGSAPPSPRARSSWRAAPGPAKFPQSVSPAPERPPGGREAGQIDLHDVQPVVKVFAELALLGEPLAAACWWPRRRERQTSIVCEPPTRSKDRSCRTAQQLGLHGGRNLADLIQEDGAPRWPFRNGLRLGPRRRERAFLVPEQLALQERLRQRGTVHRNERLLPSAAMTRARPVQQVPCRCPSPPKISTWLTVSATWLISSNTSCIRGLLLRML